jgi:tetratricopeptide (TPR) repeat protein
MDRRRLRAAAALLCLCLAHGAIAHEPAMPPATRVLGALSFPTSTKSAPAQAAFNEGMLLLHIFEYPSAAKSFQRAQALDPGFVMAYWGEAMTYTHPVWNQQDLEAGRAALAKLAPSADGRARKAETERELDFLHAAEVLYGDGDKHARDLAFLAEMEAMATRYSQDDEVQLFLALALLGADEGSRNVPRYLRAAEISQAVYRRNPQHPGAAHYWIHGMDDPQHAAGALEAANSLAKIAPDAGHSQHMTAHIFIALGRWQDVVDANVAAMRVVNAELATRQQPAYQCGHYAEWLEYAWMQQGREDEAYKLLGDCARSGPEAVAWMRAHPGEAYLNATAADRLQENFDGSLARMRAMALVDAPAHRKLLLADSKRAGDDAGLLFARGWAQLDAGELRAARGSAKELAALVAPKAGAGADADDNLTYPRIMARLLDGALLVREGKAEQGLEVMRAATKEFEAQPVEFGPPVTVKPPRELLGEALLAAGRKAEAKAEFERALAAAPERRASKAGLAQASGVQPATH